MARYKHLTSKQDELLKEYRREIKVANERLRQLEILSKQPEFENVLKYAYRLAERDIKELGIGNLDKVRYRVPQKGGVINTNKLESALRRVKQFNTGYKTTTKSDIINTYQKDATSLNNKLGTNFTWQEMKTYLDSMEWEKMKKDLGSDVVVKVIKSVTENNVTESDILEAIEHNKTIEGLDGVESDWTKRIYDKYNLNVDDLYSGTEETEDDSDNPFIIN